MIDEKNEEPEVRAEEPEVREQARAEEPKAHAEEQFNLEGEFIVGTNGKGAVCFRFANKDTIGVPPNKAVELGRAMIDMGLQAMSTEEQQQTVQGMMGESKMTPEAFVALQSALEKENQYPEGKLDQDDNGVLAVMLEIKKDNVFLVFPKQITQFGMPPHIAVNLAIGLLDASKKITQQQDGEYQPNSVAIACTQQNEVKMIFEKAVNQHSFDAQTALKIAQSITDAAGVASCDKKSTPDFHSVNRVQ